MPIAVVLPCCNRVLSSSNQPQIFTQYAQNEQSVPSLVLGTVGGQGYYQVQRYTHNAGSPHGREAPQLLLLVLTCALLSIGIDC